MCASCGWERDPLTVWPPSIPHDVPPPVAPVNKIFLGLQLIFGTFLGALMTFLGTYLFLIGPIATVGLFFGYRKSKPFFAYGFLCGLGVGFAGIAACVMLTPPYNH